MEEIVTATASELASHFNESRLDQMSKLADKFYKAKCFGGGIQNAEQALVMMQAGYEMGMPPVEAINSLYIVNGKITIYGAAMSKRLRLRGWSIQYDDQGLGASASCTVTITKGDEQHSYTATAQELMALNSKAFKFAPKEKIRWHALSRLIRFEVPEILDAGVAYLREEMLDVPVAKHEKAIVEVVEEVTPTNSRPHLKALQVELKNRGAANKEEALNILRQLPSGSELLDLDLTEELSQDLLIQLLQAPADKEEETAEIANMQEPPVDERQEALYFDCTDFQKVKKILAGLSTVHECVGLDKEIKTSFKNGDCTESVYRTLMGMVSARIAEINDGVNLPKRAKKIKKMTA